MTNLNYVHVRLVKMAHDFDQSYVKVQEKPIKLYIGKHRLKKKINNRLKTTVLTLCTIKWGKLNAQGEILPSKHSCPRGPSYQLW